MDELDLLDRFERHRPRLRGVAYRMLGSVSEADDAVQEAWLRASRADVDAVENLAAWLTTVVGRICLNTLRRRTSRREEPWDERTAASGSAGARQAGARQATDPEEEALLADSVGHAMLVVLQRLSPAERLAFILHDMFDLPFAEIAPVVGRSVPATRQLASRARRRVRGAPADPDAARQRRMADAYLAATRTGDLDGLIRILDPDVVLRADAAASPSGAAVVVRGAPAVAEGAVASAAAARFAGPALVDGKPGLVLVRRGRLLVAMTFTVVGTTFTEIEVVAEPDRLHRLDVGLPGGSVVEG